MFLSRQHLDAYSLVLILEAGQRVGFLRSGLFI